MQVLEHGLKTKEHTEFVERLARLKNLKSRSVASTKITDSVVKKLTQMSSSRWLDVTDARMTDAGVKEPKKALPNCEIVD
jgi:hypothetical protein